MKRLVGVCVVAFIAVLSFRSSIVFADNGPHGGYTPTTDACAGCHRAHTAQGAKLLKEATGTNDVSGFCYSCHAVGTGAYTDVKSGVFIISADVVTATESTFVPTTNRGLQGGGFESVLMNTDLSVTGSVPMSTTSSHMVQGGSNIVWGFGVTSTTENSGAGDVALTCTNCHNPHGKAGLGGTATYRILKGRGNNTPLFNNGTVSATAGVDVPDEAPTPRYYINAVSNPWPAVDASTEITGSYFGQHTRAPFNGSSPEPYALMTSWCAGCHTRYMQQMSAGPGHTDSGDAVFKFRHGTNLDSSQSCYSCHIGMHGPDPKVYPGCISCHVAHGTGAKMGTYSNAVPYPGGAITTTASARSSLLRLDNRGVCQGCHKK